MKGMMVHCKYIVTYFLLKTEHYELHNFFDLGIGSPIFFTQKRPFSVIWGAKKWVFGRPNKKTDTTFCRQLYPKMVDETLVSLEYHYRVSFGPNSKTAYIRLIFGRFPLIKSQNQNPMARSVKYEV